jgi:hypothetical protein
VTLSFSTPIILLIFNRPELTARVFAEIARQKPKRLLVIADGPRASNPDDIKLCQAARDIVQQIDWDCELSAHFSDVNLGLRARVSSGLDWAFEQVDEALIFEDDCVPDSTTFEYCRQLLERYRNDPQVMHISCVNLTGQRDPDSSYYGSRYPHVWGWATWRRAWRLYGETAAVPPSDALTERVLASFENPSVRRFWKTMWHWVRAGKIDSWAYSWAFTCQVHNGLSITPNVNLVSNIGFGEVATHTTDVESSAHVIPTESMTFPLRHPAQLVVHAEADRIVEDTFFSLPSRLRLRLSAARRVVHDKIGLNK